MNAVGMGGYITAKGWVELGTSGSSKLKIGMFNINNAAKSGKLSDSEEGEMKSVDEFILAMRTLRVAAQFVCNWNLGFVALENFFLQKKFMEEELRHDENPARTLCQFTNFIINENAGRWRDGSSFVYFGELKGFWDAFVGARPQVKSIGHNKDKGTPHSSLVAGHKHQKDRKRKYPWSDICNRYNTNNCSKSSGSCFNFRGTQMKHICNWRDPAVPNSQPCGQGHPRVGNH
jgi:hypothetical protein